MTIKTDVERLLNEDEQCRNSDLYLILKFWEKYNGLEIDQSILNKILESKRNTSPNLVNSETIRRNRQKFQEAGKYPPTDPVVKAFRERHK